MSESIFDRIYNNWSYDGLTAAVFLIALIPLLWGSWFPFSLLALVQLIAYMGHQVEEYFHDNFRTFVNTKVAGGREALNRQTVLFVNIVGIWGVDLVVLYLTRWVRPGLCLIAVYLTLVNAVVHLLMAAVNRAYNPGLVSATLLLLPAGAWGVWLTMRSHQVSRSDHLLGIGIAVLIHLLLVLHILRRVKLVKSALPAAAH